MQNIRVRLTQLQTIHYTTELKYPDIGPDQDALRDMRKRSILYPP